MTKQEADRIIQIMNKGFEAVDKRFEAIDERFDEIDKRFSTRDEKFDAAMVVIHERFEDVNDRFDAMLRYVDRRFDEVLTKEEWRKEWAHHMTLMDNIMTEIGEIRQQRLFSGEHNVRIDTTVDDHEKRIQKLEKTVA